MSAPDECYLLKGVKARDRYVIHALMLAAGMLPRELGDIGGLTSVDLHHNAFCGECNLATLSLFHVSRSLMQHFLTGGKIRERHSLMLSRGPHNGADKVSRHTTGLPR